ncbi:MAG: sugar ABC transporter permease [Hungatella sp.]|nr:sugar ABC transporter permease [Hungatella sp.]
MKKKPMTMDRRKERTAYLFIVLPVLYFLLFRMIPTLFSLILSFMKWDLLSPNKEFIGLENFISVITDKTLQKVLWNTVEYVIVCVPLMIVISLALALMLNSIEKGKSFFRLLVFIPYVTSSVAISYVWKWMFMQNGGIVNGLLRMVGISAQPFLNSPDQSIFVIMSNVVWSNIGFNTIILLAGLMQIPRTYYEAAQIDGASPWNQFRYITIRQLNPTLVYTTVMGTIRTLQVFTQVYNIAGTDGGPLKSTSSIVLEIYNTAFKQYKMGRASAITVILFLFIMIITLFQMKVLNKETD